ncbi:hypothetical protein AA313_de0205010 [Arthrobotrys entomopaga]|nr:hypothetical protein AA313_de0205010 [Arthrobotrys entomopaga]
MLSRLVSTELENWRGQGALHQSETNLKPLQTAVCKRGRRKTLLFGGGRSNGGSMHACDVKDEHRQDGLIGGQGSRDPFRNHSPKKPCVTLKLICVAHPKTLQIEQHICFLMSKLGGSR